MDTSLLAFVSVSIFVIATPGPDTALTVRNTLAGGRRGGVFTALGIMIGQAIWAFATSLGIVAVLLASEPVFHAVRLGGAAYLIYLGVRALYQAIRSDRLNDATADEKPARRLSSAAAFGQGLASDLSNPKMAAFFTSLLPQFALPGDGAFLQLMLFGALFCLMTFTWLVLYALAVARAGDFLRRRNVKRVLEGLMGAALIGLGLRIASEHR
ncbi:MAG: LysE family translocator [Alphaproteobacteria bacterium]|nr:LysE family translocator [Alphaproteobacteria bacterium]